ncbi:MAG: ASCH domain-containing protein [Mesorhizobium sp.]|uniref:ASCH domain-containing protein n=1 Tax=Mesorhizobium sp. TaxID=1871066 RepID=UPI000FEA9B16|nr:ASCH domain-containing protein [Mesorhizobium sp.]RWD48639.1 MAG: ASCH domain-containing protein [Mesorhizobium sp.]RWE60180.1 MAG: ASCH domain-containing protein [Mesorhizobium sp.]RWF11633.1 MAG: ASCH domain-containing protein [Mesorhizobium sp.]RWF18176.1 MAG: ASCH domain-containing protein [Mesorhizobium sp.]
MKITKGLIIADPWIGYLLDGSKTWEMRSSATSHRGWFGIIRKGTGAVYGVAKLAEVGMPLSPADMIATFERHRIPEHMIRSGEVAKWNVPWKLSDVRRLDRPVPYRHKSGAVTWVELNEQAIEGIAAALRRNLPEAAIAGHVPEAEVVADKPPPTASPGFHADEEAATAGTRSTPASGAASRWIGEIEINDANLRNNHFYLRPLIGKFPDDVIGGSNKASKARGEVMIDWGGPEPVRTEIDGKDKKFFRARGWIGAFYKLHRAQAGDLVVIEETAPYRYRVSLRKRGSPGRAS